MKWLCTPSLRQLRCKNLQSPALVISMLAPPENCFDGYYTALKCCNADDSFWMQHCWQGQWQSVDCCNSWALQARDHLRKALRQAKLSQGPVANAFDLSEFSIMGMSDTAITWVVTDADLLARESFQLGHRQLLERCSHEALREDEDSAAIRLWDMLGHRRTGRLLNLGAGSWRDPLWEIALHRNVTGLFVDPVGPPKDMPSLQGIRFVSEFVRPNNMPRLLRSAGFRSRPGFPMPIDFKKVDVDSCDCVLASIGLQFVRPSIIIMEINWSLPPPLRFVRQCHDAWSRMWQYWRRVGFSLSTHGCSLSGALAELTKFGYSLFRVAGHVNAFFVHRDVAASLGGAEVDEVFCFNQAWQDSSVARYVHWRLIHDWRTGSVVDALNHVWGNFTSYDSIFNISHIPFALAV